MSRISVLIWIAPDLMLGFLCHRCIWNFSPRLVLYIAHRCKQTCFSSTDKKSKLKKTWQKQKQAGAGLGQAQYKIGYQGHLMLSSIAVIFHWGHLQLKSSSIEVVFHWCDLSLRLSSIEVVLYWGDPPFIFYWVCLQLSLSFIEFVFHWGCIP